MSTDPLRSRLGGRVLLAEQTIACRLARPDGFTFTAGQYVDVTVINPPERDAEGPTRSFSIASAPHEEELLIVMRLRDTAFKRTFATMPIGTEIFLEGPMEDFDLDPESDRPLVFIAGGVGIAPVLSILRDAVQNRRSLNATLFYSNRRPEDTVFLAELQAMTTALSHYRCIATMTRLAESKVEWTGETTRLGRAMVERYLPALQEPDYLISGSPGLIAGLRYALVIAGVPDARIRIEMFGGY